MTSSVSPLDLGRKVFALLSLESGDPLEISRLKNGAVYISKPVSDLVGKQGGEMKNGN